MEKKTKQLSQMIGDIKIGDEVIFETKRSGDYIGQCQETPSRGNPEDKFYYFSREKQKFSRFAVCPTSETDNLRLIGGTKTAINYRIISRAKQTPSAPPRRTIRTPAAFGIGFGIQYPIDPHP